MATEYIDSISLPTALNKFPERESATDWYKSTLIIAIGFSRSYNGCVFQDDLEEVYRSRFDGLVPNGAEHRIFQCFMVMAIGMLLLVKKDISAPYLISDQLLTSAAKIAEERPVAIFRGDLDHLEVLVRGQFISLHPGASEAYYAVSLAIRLAADHGLHETNRIVELLQDLSRLCMSSFAMGAMSKHTLLPHYHKIIRLRVHYFPYKRAIN